MVPHRRVDVRVLLRNRHRGAGGFKVAAGIDDQPHTVLGHGGEQFAAIRVELLVVIMRVCIKDQCHQHILAPAGILSSNMTRFSFSSPFSLWTAEISIPQLSRPIILRGGRLMIASSVLPTSCSGS